MAICEGCTKDGARLKCPTCVKDNLGDSYYCSQTCFKDNWAAHRAKHATPNPTQRTYDPWPNHRYTGGLRPSYPLSQTRVVPEHIPRPDYAEDGKPYGELKLRGSTRIEALKPDEIDKMRTVCRIGREVLNIGRNALKVGVTTDEIDRVVHEACVERDAYPSPLNYQNFPKSCCISVNEVICHGIPDQYELQNGDLCNIDVSVFYDGFHSDLNGTYCVGEVDEAGRRLVDTARKCLDEAIKMVRPGTLYRDVGNVISKVASAQGFSVARSYTGHGIHRLFHTTPNIPHYAKNKAVGVMKPGHVFTIEPMINEGSWRDEHWLDNWTVVTADGKRSAQFEETMIVTETGVEVLTADFEN
ncbi:peptidase M24, structural domain-containing protein [Cladochytrium replicatum]|nr:peptidase M24, structural domain-containing protein [Cladochytrium replicatum]